jgi:PAS domain S-box-containing protein
MFKPVYRHGLPVETVEQRRAAILGWVYSPYRMTDLINGTLRGWDVKQKDRHIYLQIYDGEVLSADTLLYDSHTSGDTTQPSTPQVIRLVTLDFAGRRWTLRFTQAGGLAVDYSSAWLVLLSGTWINLLLFGLAFLLFNTRTHARQMAEQLTSELRESEEKYRVIFNNEIYAICIFDLETYQLLDINEAYTRLYGYSREELLSGMTIHDITAEDQVSITATNQAIQEGTIFIPVRYHRKKDGTVFPVEIVGGPYTWQGRKVMFGLAHDITQRKQAEELVSQTRQNYEGFFNTIDDFLFVLDDQGNIIHVNQTVLERLEFTEAELSGKSVLMVHPEARREEAGRIVGDIMVGKAEFCPIPVMTKSGIQIPVETRISAGIWNGKPVFFGVTKDISHITLSEEKFAKVFHLNPSACGLSDLNTGQYVEVNEAFCSIFGFSKEEVVGKTAMELGMMFPETRSSILSKADADGKVSNTETILRDKHGKNINVLLSAENIYIQDKKYRFTVATDISERKQMEQELQAQRDFATQIINTMGQGLTVTGEDGCFEFVNPAYARMLGYESADLIGKQPTDVTVPDDHSVLYEQKEKRTAGITSTYESRLRRADGRITHVLVTAVPRGHDGQFAGAIAVITDLTERLQAEEKIRQLNASLEQHVRQRTALLEASNQELETFAYTVSHDLRSPLRALDGFSDMLISEYSGQLDQQGVHYLTRIREGAQRMGYLIEDLLNLSKVTRIELTRQSVDLSQLAEEIVANLHSQDPQRQVDVEISPNLVVDGDANLLKIMLESLLRNAFKFSSQQKKAAIEFGMRDQAGERVYFVRDNGDGFDMAYADKLFAPFQRLHAMNEFPGNGIGLVTAKRIITRHGGRIWVEARVNQGATFYFTLR